MLRISGCHESPEMQRMVSEHRNSADTCFYFRIKTDVYDHSLTRNIGFQCEKSVFDCSITLRHVFHVKHETNRPIKNGMWFLLFRFFI
ncbi:hypothetical protein SKAU_G00064250 [Synaphobranchus kaupii]|uniref:Uncharacterized protein n=1 Tax=Synaphobranchus kaupii TaxID=118154 RepID=A0A9Q1G706_SYNKA|nr:hypothetical protein SKAU_G00064250 [Synaphobranchus kaupii]